MNISLSTNLRLGKTVVKPLFGLSISAVSTLAFAAIQTCGLPGDIEWTSPLHSTHALLTGCTL